MATPELSGPAELYYNNEESTKYNKNTRIMKIQRDMTLRAIELMEIEAGTHTVLDLGCGGGLSGQCLSEHGCIWVGADISAAMLACAESLALSSGLLQCDIGEPLPLRPESFDYAISISAVQWLFQSYKKEHVPARRIRTFFRSLYSVVREKAVLQFYCSKKEVDILVKEARVAGFYGGLVVDNEGTKNCKYFLVLDKYKRQPKNAAKSGTEAKSAIFSKKRQAILEEDRRRQRRT